MWQTQVVLAILLSGARFLGWTAKVSRLHKSMPAKALMSCGEDSYTSRRSQESPPPRCLSVTAPTRTATFLVGNPALEQ